MFHHAANYPQPLEGWFFTWTSDVLRTNGHYPGGSLPSPHCAAGTIMLVMLYRYQRRVYYVALPVIISLYVATVYGRFHYVEDGIAGIIAALAVIKFTPAIVTAINNFKTAPFATMRFMSANLL
jgi:membrane-associated phospholipid phosphatase